MVIYFTTYAKSVTDFKIDTALQRLQKKVSLDKQEPLQLERLRKDKNEPDAFLSINLIRLLTRVIFAYFLKEKDLVPAVLFNRNEVQNLLRDTSPQAVTYYKAILQNLFFASLNQETDARRWQNVQEKNYNNPDYGADLYRYKDFFQDPDIAFRLFNQIPFLNGGLFDKLPEDLFSSNVLDAPFLPNELFWGDEIEIDVSEIYGDKKRIKEKTRGLIHILNAYKFTIEENTPLEQEVALDPELLGKVFENLLASYNPETAATARKQTGSFYTPREIVDYMVETALRAYFANKLKLSFSDPNFEEKFDTLLGYESQQNPFSLTETDLLIDAIDKLKILDPACGSGAYPMGILHLLVRMLAVLDPGNVKWKQKMLQNTPPEFRAAFEEELKNKSLDYTRKLGLIQRCIYGIDVQAIAVQIAKLRCFISLVVDQQKNIDRPNFGLQSLPNLETKFVAANTLIKRSRTGVLTLGADQIRRLMEEVNQIREEYFYAKDKNTKKQLRKKDQEATGALVEYMEASGWKRAEAQQLAAWNPYDQNASAEFFDSEWMFGIKDGFDIVIGNPPYVQIQKFSGKPEQKAWQDQNYQTFAKTGDIYCLFYERAFQLLAPNGIVAYITSNKWMRAGYGESMRTFFAQKTQPLVLIDFGGVQVFETATVDTNIYIGTVPARDEPTLACVIDATVGKKDGEHSLKDLHLYLRQNAAELPIAAAGKAPWVVTTDRAARLKQKIEALGTPLKDWDIQIYRGILTGFNEAFIIDTATKERLCAEDPRSAEIIRPILRGRDIKKWKADWAGLWVIATLPSLNLDIENYSAVKEHLLSFGKDRLAQTGNPGARKKTHNDWFETQDPIAYHQEFAKHKVIYPNMTKFLPFIYDKEGYYTNQKCFIMNGQDIKYLTIFLNSNIFKFCFKDSFPELLGGTRELSKIFFELIPVKQVSQTENERFAQLLDKILLKPENKALEKEAELAIAELYGLTKEEIALIENFSKKN